MKLANKSILLLPGRLYQNSGSGSGFENSIRLFNNGNDAIILGFVPGDSNPANRELDQTQMAVAP
jgi:hypothetical protein